MERDILIALNHSMHISARTFELIKKYCNRESLQIKNSPLSLASPGMHMFTAS